MEITTELVKHLANLSRLKFTDKEIEGFKKEFEQTLLHVEAISKVDTSKVELQRNSLNAKNELREDKVVPYLTQGEVILNAPDKKQGMIVVPSVVE